MSVAMFPDSEIASQFKMAHSKSMYGLNHGLTPHFKSLLDDTLKWTTQVPWPNRRFITYWLTQWVSCNRYWSYHYQIFLLTWGWPKKYTSLVKSAEGSIYEK